RRRARSCPTTSDAPNRTSGSGTSTRSCRGRSCGRRLGVCCASSGMRVEEPVVSTEADPGLRERLTKLAGVTLRRDTKLSAEMERLQRQLDRLKEDATDEEIWNRVLLARHQDRPYTLDYVERIFGDFFELHGDRSRLDDAAVVTGIGSLGGRT